MMVGNIKEEVPEQEPEEQIETIPRKIAAIEVHKRLRTIMFLGFYAVGAAVIPSMFASANAWAGAAAAAIFAGMAAYISAKTIREMKIMEHRYNLNWKK